MRLLAIEDFEHPVRGHVPREEVWEDDDELLVQKLVQAGTALYTNRRLRHMKKIKALKLTKEPSTGSTIFDTQVLNVSDDDARMLVAAGDARDAHDDEELTRDVGKLRSQVAAPKGEE